MDTISLTDRFGRTHTSLRVSVTDRCNLRCFYCMPEENVNYLPRKELLTYEEIIRVINCLVKSAGIRKVRITGGEPLVRQDLPELITHIASIRELRELSLTTNGILLDQQAEKLFRAGLRRINISLDTLDRERFQLIARRDSLSRVLDGLRIAQEVGFQPIKINAVAMRGITEEDLVPLAELSRETGIEVRFIEYMPLDADQKWERDKVLFAQQMREHLAREIMPLIAVEKEDPHRPARSYRFADGRGTIGFIASVSAPFCSQCNRFRLTADGKLRNCLFSLEETDLRTAIRTGRTDAELLQLAQQCIESKGPGHEINSAKFLQPLRPMHAIGG